MPRPHGWTDQFCIDELLRRTERLADRVETLEEEFMRMQTKSGNRSQKPTARGKSRAVGVKP